VSRDRHFADNEVPESSHRRKGSVGQKAHRATITVIRARITAGLQKTCVQTTNQWIVPEQKDSKHDHDKCIQRWQHYVPNDETFNYDEGNGFDE